MPFYLTQWECVRRERDGMSCQPVGSQPGQATIDLRADCGASLDGNGLNAGISVFREEVSDQRARKLADDLDEPLGQLTRAFLCSKFQLSELPARTVREFIRDLLLKPPARLPYRCAPSVDGTRRIGFGPAGYIWSDAMGTPWHEPIHIRRRPLVRDRFIRRRDWATLAKAVGSVAACTAMVNLYGFDVAWFVVFGAVLETDNFTRADAASINDASHSWLLLKGVSNTLGIFSNQVDVTDNANRNAMGNAQVTWPNDQYCQAKFVIVQSGISHLIVRGKTDSGTTRNFYCAGDDIINRGDHITALKKSVANVESEIANSGSIDISAGNTVYLETQGGNAGP